MRPTWDETRMAMAREIAQRSLCVKAKVGAIITGPDGKHIVGEGFNGPPAGYRHDSQPCNIWCKRTTQLAPAPDYSDCVTIHAESNALLKSDYSKRLGGTIYITSHPCWGCAKLIANSGLRRIVVDSDAAHLHRDPMTSYRFLMECGLEVNVTDQMIMSRLSTVRTGNDLWQSYYPERLAD
jgi:dCMP deaminase